MLDHFVCRVHPIGGQLPDLEIDDLPLAIAGRERVVGLVCIQIARAAVFDHVLAAEFRGFGCRIADRWTKKTALEREDLLSQQLFSIHAGSFRIQFNIDMTIPVISARIAYSEPFQGVAALVARYNL
jgi:hypothetical protein